MLTTNPAPSHCGQIRGLVPGLPPVPEQSGHGASELSRSEMVTPSIASVKPMVVVVSTSAPLRGRVGLLGAAAAEAAAEEVAEHVAEPAAGAAAGVAQQVVEVEAAASGPATAEAAASRRASASRRTSCASRGHR